MYTCACALSAVVPRAGRIGRFFVPLENRQLRVAAVDHDPSDRLLALLAANLTSINPVDHPEPPRFSPASAPNFLSLFQYLQIQRLFQHAIHLADVRQRALQCRRLARLHRDHKRQRVRRITRLLHNRANIDPLLRQRAGNLRDNARPVATRNRM